MHGFDKETEWAVQLQVKSAGERSRPAMHHLYMLTTCRLRTLLAG